MKKYTTKPINFDGCHPVIAEALKRGEAIECRVWDSYKEHHESKFVICYHIGNTCPYITYDNAYKHAEPVPIKTRRIMPPERAIPILIAERWEFNNFGDLICPGEAIPSHTFQYFGKPCDTPVAAARLWPSCIIEEVEDDDE